MADEERQVNKTANPLQPGSSFLTVEEYQNKNSDYMLKVEKEEVCNFFYKII